MSMTQQAPPAEAVEEQLGKIVTELGAALGVLLTSLGIQTLGYRSGAQNCSATSPWPATWGMPGDAGAR